MRRHEPEFAGISIFRAPPRPACSMVHSAGSQQFDMRGSGAANGDNRCSDCRSECNRRHGHEVGRWHRERFGGWVEHAVETFTSMLVGAQAAMLPAASPAPVVMTASAQTNAPSWRLLAPNAVAMANMRRRSRARATGSVRSLRRRDIVLQRAESDVPTEREF